MLSAKKEVRDDRVNVCCHRLMKVDKIEAPNVYREKRRNKISAQKNLNISCL